MNQIPSRESMDYGSLLAFSVAKLGLRPTDFWQLTFGEFWPMYNAIVGKTIQPLSEMELENLEDSWTGKNGNT